MNSQKPLNNENIRSALIPTISLSITLLLLITVGVQTWHISSLGDQVAELKEGNATERSKVDIKVDNNTDKSKNEDKALDNNSSSNNSGITRHSPFDVDWFSRPFDDTSWDPFQEMEAMREQMNQMFDGSFSRFGMSSKFGGLSDSRNFTPDIDLSESDDSFIVTVDVPGSENNNINVTLEGQILTISGFVEEEIENKNKTQLRKERRSGRFTRSLTLPAPVEEMGMNTSVENGVMTITIKKKKPAYNGFGGDE